MNYYAQSQQQQQPKVDNVVYNERCPKAMNYEHKKFTITTQHCSNTTIHGNPPPTAAH